MKLPGEWGNHNDPMIPPQSRQGAIRNHGVFYDRAQGSLSATQVSRALICWIQWVKDTLRMIALGLVVTLWLSEMGLFYVIQGRGVSSYEVPVDKHAILPGGTVRKIHTDAPPGCCASTGGIHVIYQPIRIISVAPRLIL